jgi:hypothetical protein
MYRGNSAGGSGIPHLDPSQLFEKRAQRDSARLKAYNEILGQIHTRIYTVSQMPGNTSSLVYTVPPFLLGLPAIDLQDCIVYLVSILRNNGFVVRYTYPNLLSISWKHYEAQYNREMNPIVQAMTPPPAPAPTSKKGAGGKRGMGDRGPSVTFAPLPFISEAAPQAQQQPKSAADYRPPDSFLQNLAKPPPPPRAPMRGSAPPAAPGTGDVLADLWQF